MTEGFYRSSIFEPGVEYSLGPAEPLGISDGGRDRRLRGTFAKIVLDGAKAALAAVALTTTLFTTAVPAASNAHGAVAIRSARPVAKPPYAGNAMWEDETVFPLTAGRVSIRRPLVTGVSTARPVFIDEED